MYGSGLWRVTTRVPRRRSRWRRGIGSFAVVKKLLALRRRTGSVAPVGHRGGRKSMFTPARRRLISQLVRHRPDITLAELREALGLTCALSTLHHVLVAMGLTFKKDVARGRAGARADIKAGRRRWKSKRRNWHRSRLVFIDEAGAKTNMTRRYGRSRRCHDSAPHGHGATTSIIASVRSDGSTTHTAVSGATNTENFRSYVRDVLAPTLRPLTLEKGSGRSQSRSGDGRHRPS
ncbi:hypothetical protein DB346_13940 [Verrucomicrobia bacterium LW23]|nr:hypothetical protein DB346_13940 [Verrucomicrobia bacterium LW23]